MEFDHIDEHAFQHGFVNLENEIQAAILLLLVRQTVRALLPTIYGQERRDATEEQATWNDKCYRASWSSTFACFICDILCIHSMRAELTSSGTSS